MRALALLIFIILQMSCIRENVGRSTRIRTIKNISNHKVDLVITSKETTSYHLDIGDSIVLEGYCETGASDLCFVGWDELYFISGKIIFDEEREIFYPNGNCNNQHNPFGGIRVFDLCGYVERTFDNRREYIYLIDNSDYDVAVPIED